MLLLEPSAGRDPPGDVPTHIGFRGSSLGLGFMFSGMDSGFGVQGSGFKVWDAGFKI